MNSRDMDFNDMLEVIIVIELNIFLELDIITCFNYVYFILKFKYSYGNFKNFLIEIETNWIKYNNFI